MTVPTKQTKHELAFRSSGGIDVTLLWDRANGELTVTAFNTGTGELLEVPARRDKALDVFNHPFAYASCETASRSEHALAA